MTGAQIAAVVIFLAMFAAIVSGKTHRYIPALTGAALTIVIVFLLIMKSPTSALNVLNLSQLGQLKFWLPGEEQVKSHGVNWQTIIFIAGMMVLVEGLSKVGFFRWICFHTARIVNYRVLPILVAFMILSGFLAMFIDSITVLLFLASVTIELARLLRFDPVPMIIAEIFAANVGGSATMCGDPPNIIIGTAFGYTFTDFAINTGPIAWAGMAVSVAYFYIRTRHTLTTGVTGFTPQNEHSKTSEAVTNPKLFWLLTATFALIVLLLITHAETGLSVAAIGVIATLLTLPVSWKESVSILRRLDWRTLLFFLGLFVCVGGLEETGVLNNLANYIGEISGGKLTLVIPIILWVSAFASSIVDNIPFAATMVPVISHLSHTAGLSLATLSWSLALGTDIGGNATPIGASANVVGTAIAEREGYPIRWGRFLRYALPATMLVVALCHLLLVLRYT